MNNFAHAVHNRLARESDVQVAYIDMRQALMDVIDKCTDLAQHIRSVDGDNRAHPADLASDIAGFLMPQLPMESLLATLEEIKSFVFYRNRGKTLSASGLADAIVNRFNLEDR
jgi:hypothetical protein